MSKDALQSCSLGKCDNVFTSDLTVWGVLHLLSAHTQPRCYSKCSDKPETCVWIIHRPFSFLIFMCSFSVFASVSTLFHWLLQAKEYFQMDGYVTDHIEILQDHSSLFRALAFFEEDLERRCKMHKRRVDMLEPICSGTDIILWFHPFHPLKKVCSLYVFS